MSFIQDIREKYARWAVVAIALSLLGFILMDAFAGRGSVFSGGPSTTVGKVNGSKIDIKEFNKLVLQQENYQQQQRQSSISETDRRGIMDNVWNDMVNKILLQNELDKLGMQVGKKETNDILFGANAPEDLKKQFKNTQTGEYDAVLAQQQINEMKKRGAPDQKANFNEYIGQLEYQRVFEKYNSLLVNTYNFPKWYLEKQNADKSLIANISYVMVNYVDPMFVDSTIKISDKEIENYISKHKEKYKQEETREIAYVAFSAKPRKADSLEAIDKLMALKAEFETAENIQQFFDREGNSSQFYDGYLSGKSNQRQNKDSILAAPIGSVYGPFLDGTDYVLSKKLGSKMWPDTVKVRHILIGLTKQDQSGQSITRDSLTAKTLADSIAQAIKNGSNFDILCAQFSDDPGSKDKGGVYDNVYAGQMVPEFNKFIFDNLKGDKGVVKTDFGYHYIEILSQKGNSPAYKIAYLSRPIEPSQETDNIANNEANKFAGNSRNTKAFDENIEKILKPLGINKLLASNIGPNDYMAGGLSSRQFVKKIYEAKLNDVLQPIRIGEDYIVATVTAINKKGTQSVEKARGGVEALLRNKKKAEIVKQKIGKISSLEAAHTALNKPIDNADSIRLQGQSPALSYEPKVLGASFNMDNNNKTIPELIEGTGGVYVIHVKSISATPVESANVEEERKLKYQNAKQTTMYRFAQVLKDAANIKDNRSTHF